MSRAAAAGRTVAPFAHLHVASAFSAHYGVSWPEDLVAAAAAADMDLLACTDRDGLYGMAKHVGACLRHGITPIVGVDLAVRWSEDEDAGRVVVLARGGCHGSGYRSLCELVSAAHARTTGGAAGGSPWASVAELAAAAAGRVPTAANRDNPP
ncbi:PHP domain-containing protein, partial [Micrococcus luteus]